MRSSRENSDTEVGLVEINEDGLTGMCRFKMPAWDESTPAGRRRQLAVLVAGRIAERRLAGRVVSADTIAADFTEDKDIFGDWFDEDEQDDAAQVWELIEASDEAPAELLHEAAEAAVSILEERWAEVEELAKGARRIENCPVRARTCPARAHPGADLEHRLVPVCRDVQAQYRPHAWFTGNPLLERVSVLLRALRVVR